MILLSEAERSFRDECWYHYKKAVHCPLAVRVLKKASTSSTITNYGAYSRSTVAELQERMVARFYVSILMTALFFIRYFLYDRLLTFVPKKLDHSPSTWRPAIAPYMGTDSSPR